MLTTVLLVALAAVCAKGDTFGATVLSTGGSIMSKTLTVAYTSEVFPSNAVVSRINIICYEASSSVKVYVASVVDFRTFLVKAVETISCSTAQSNREVSWNVEAGWTWGVATAPIYFQFGGASVRLANNVAVAVGQTITLAAAQSAKPNSLQLVYTPTAIETGSPTYVPTRPPTTTPTIAPTYAPTRTPTQMPVAATDKPTGKPTGAPTKMPTAMVGDPHLITGDGLRYTFNGVGVFSYLRYHSLDLQVLTRHIGNGTAAIHGLAVSYGEENLVFVWNGSNSESIATAYNGELLSSYPRDLEHAKFSTRCQRRSHTRTCTVRVKDLGMDLHLRYYGRSAFTVDVPATWRGYVTGLAGNHNGDPSDDLRNPEGEVLPLSSASPSRIHHHMSKWAVPARESSFHNILPVNEECSKPHYATTFKDTQLELAANKLCAGDKFCLFDAASTQSLTYAKWTKLDMAEAVRAFGQRTVDL